MLLYKRKEKKQQKELLRLLLRLDEQWKDAVHRCDFNEADKLLGLRDGLCVEGTTGGIPVYNDEEIQYSRYAYVAFDRGDFEKAKKLIGRLVEKGYHSDEVMKLHGRIFAE